MLLAVEKKQDLNLGCKKEGGADKLPPPLTRPPAAHLRGLPVAARFEAGGAHRTVQDTDCRRGRERRSGGGLRGGVMSRRGRGLEPKPWRRAVTIP